MQHRVYALGEDRLKVGGLGHVALHELGFRVDVIAPAAAQVVQHHDAVAALDQGVGQVAADEAGAPCHEDAFAQSRTSNLSNRRC